MNLQFFTSGLLLEQSRHLALMDFTGVRGLDLFIFFPDFRSCSGHVGDGHICTSYD